MADLPTRPVWAEISLGALLHNYRRLQQQALSVGAECVCVIKANAYGHDAWECMRLLSSAGAYWFAMTSIEEAIHLHKQHREHGGAPHRMLVLSGLYPGEAEIAVEYGMTPVLSTPQQVEWLAQAATKQHYSRGEFDFHLEVDTGMARQGTRWDDNASLEACRSQLDASSPLRLEGVMTHLASPEDRESPQNQQQIARFGSAVARLAAVGLSPQMLHCGNSATLFEPAQAGPLSALAKQYGAQWFVRPGIALYGYGPHARMHDLSPVLTWKTRITALRWLDTGEPVSYNATFRCTRRTRIALLSVGYADGYSRLLSNRGHVLVRGEQAPVVGRVTMDQTMVDVTDIPAAEIGDEVVLLGSQGGREIRADDLAALADTISYEVLCAISARVPRVAVD